MARKTVAFKLPRAFRAMEANILSPPERFKATAQGIWTLSREILGMQYYLWRIRGFFRNHREYRYFHAEARRLTLLRLQIGAYEPLRRLMSRWRAFHIVLPCLLVGVIGVHVGVSIYLGYGPNP